MPKGALHQPIRMCVFCRRRLPKRDMRRFVLKNGIISMDETFSYPSRGAYCCMDKRCLERLQHDAKGVLKKALSPRSKR